MVKQITALCIFLLLPSNLSAETSCPDYIRPDSPRITHSHQVIHGDWQPPPSGFPLTTPIRVEAATADNKGKRIYRMPLGYRLGWTREASPKDFDINAIHDGAYFTFWMPEKRFPELPLGHSTLTQNHGCEHGRPPPTEDQYFVTFGIGRMGGPEMDYLGRRSFVNWKLLKEDGSLTTKYGLIHYSYLPPYEADPIPRDYYLHPDGFPYQITFKCIHWGANICMGQAYFPEENLTLSIDFPTAHMENWRQILLTAVEFLTAWEVDSPYALTDQQKTNLISKIKETKQ